MAYPVEKGSVGKGITDDRVCCVWRDLRVRGCPWPESLRQRHAAHVNWLRSGPGTLAVDIRRLPWPSGAGGTRTEAPPTHEHRLRRTACDDFSPTRHSIAPFPHLDMTLL